MDAGRKYFHSKESLKLESGDELPEVTIAYHTFGAMNPDKSNVVWVMHALTADSDVSDWWPHTVEAGRFLDPARYFVVCANVLGSCYGTTGPMSVNPATGKPYYDTFPEVTVRDMVECHKRLARHLGIEHIDTMIGSSLGGFQAIEWLVSEPDIATRAVLVATDYRCRPWLAAINQAMTMAIEADSTYGLPEATAARAGLSAARAIGLLVYRGQAAYDLTQDDRDMQHGLFKHRVQTYLTHQGDKLCNRFDAYSYVRMCRSADAHDVGRGRGGHKKALAAVKAKCLVVAISSDILFPAAYHHELVALLPDAEYREIISSFAHDGFLVERDQLNTLINEFTS